MWTYNKTLQYPINIKCPDPRLAKVIISQYGGPDGELAASLRYLSQRFGMPDQKAKAILNDIGTEELVEEIEKAGLAPYYTDHGVDVYPQSAAGVPFDATCLACKGDPIANLQEDLAAEQKARATYEKLIDLCRDNPDVLDPLRYLRQREVVHFQRFGEALRGVQDKLAERKFYTTNCKEN